MRSTVKYGSIVLLLLLAAAAVRAGISSYQEWTDNQSGAGFDLFDVGNGSFNNLADGGMVSAEPLTGHLVIGVQPTAAWDPNVYRIYAIDYDAGNDARSCWATASANTLAAFEVADQAAGAVACKTMQQIGALVPRQGAGRKIAFINASRSGGASYLKQDGVTVDSLDSFMSGLTGYSQILIWGTGTNSTCGATKFTGDVNDFTCAGAIPVTGTNASGYNPTAGASTSAIPLTKVGGGAPALANEPLPPLGYSQRFDVATATTALRNVARAVSIVSTTSTTNDTVSPQSAWPTTPSAADVLYLEQPGVVCNGWGAAWDANARVSIVGIRALTLTNYQPGPIEITALKHMFDGFGGSTALGTTTGTGIAALNQFDPGTGVGTIARGATIHIAGNVTIQPGSFPQFNSVVTEGATLLENIVGGFESIGSVMGGSFNMSGMSSNLVQSAPTLGNATGGLLQDRMIAGHVIVGGGRGNIRDIQITGVGAQPAIVLLGTGALYLLGPSGSAGNTDVGLDLTGALWSDVSIVTTPTVTGSLGDVRMCDGSIVTWAQAAAGLSDFCGNHIGSNTITKSPTGTTISGGTVTIPELGGGGNRCVHAGDGGTLSAATCPTFDAGAPVTVTGVPPIRVDAGAVALVGGYVSGSTSTTAQNLGAQASGYVKDDKDGGVAQLYTVATIPATDVTGLPDASTTRYFGEAPIRIDAGAVGITGAIVSGSASTSATQNLGAAGASGGLYATVDGGVANVSEFTIDQVLVNSSDPTAGYLASKIESGSSNVTVSVDTGAGSPALTNMLSWYKADSLALSAGASVSTWLDSAIGSTATATQTGTKRPTFQTNVLNGLPGVQFDGSTQFLTDSNNIQGASTIYVVFRETSTAGVQSVFSLKGSSGPLFAELVLLAIGGGYSPYTWVNDFASATGVGLSAALNTSAHALMYSYNGGTNSSTASYTSNLDNSSATVVSSSADSRTPTDLASIGARETSAGTGSNFFPGYIFERIVYSGVQSAPDQATTIAYLQAKWFTPASGYKISIAATSGLTACTDYVSLSCVSGATDLGGTNATPTVTGIETGGKVRGDLLVTNTAAPSTPASGVNACYTDVTSKNLACKNDAGTVNHGIQTTACSASHWINQVADNGISGCTQPSYSDIGGSVCSVLTLTGDTHTSSSCSTVTDHLSFSGGSLPLGACSTNGEAVIRDGTGALSCVLPSTDLTNDWTAPWVVGVHETSGPTQLLIGAIPASTPDATVLVRPAGSATIVGIDSNSLSVADKLAYFINITLGVSGGWIATSSSSSVLGTTAVEYTTTHIVKAVTLCANLIANGIVSGSPILVVTRNGSGIGGGAAIGLTSTTAPGVYCTSGVATGSTSATDTYGVQESNSATGTLTLTATLVLN